MGIFDKFKKNKEDLGKGSVAKKVVDVEKKENGSKTGKAKASKKTKSNKETTVKKEKKAIQIVSKKATNTIIGPVVSEKTAQLSDQGVVVFRVSKHANKVEVRHAFHELYKVIPQKVNIINMGGHSVRFGRSQGRTKDYKKAMITLPKGTRIDIFEGV